MGLATPTNTRLGTPGGASSQTRAPGCRAGKRAAMSTTTDNTQALSLVLPVSAGDRQQAVGDSIRAVRAAGRQVYACLFAAQAAGAEIQWGESLSVKPNNERAKAILAAAMGKSGKAPVYECRQYVLEYLLPDCLSFVWDQFRADVWTKWKAHDPQFPTATSGWLALQGVRRLAVFAGLGIGFPKATARPKLAEHRLTLKWDREMGPVELHLGTLDPGRWRTWRMVVSGDWPHGTIRLSERDGKLFAVVPFQRPCVQADVSADKLLAVHVAEDGRSLQIVGQGQHEHDRLDLIEARDWLARLAGQRAAWERRKAAMGSPRRPWGMPRQYRGIQGHLAKVTATRDNGQRSRNHAWARRIITRAADWGCGTVTIAQPETSELCGHPWRWPELMAAAAYKGKLLGIKVLTT